MDNQAFKTLKAKWYAKLKRSGFDDLEIEETGLLRGGPPIRNAIPRRDGRDGGPWESKAEYYRLAEHFLNEHEFDSKLEKIIWEYHSNGMSVRDIALTLNKVRKKKTTRNPVWEIVAELRTKMYALYGVK